MGFDRIPDEYTCQGLDVSPSIEIQGLNATSLAVIVDDPDAPSTREIGYAGPCPPSGKPHRYFFRVFGLDRMLSLPAGAKVADLQKAMQGHVLQKGETVATYER